MFLLFSCSLFRSSQYSLRGFLLFIYLLRWHCIILFSGLPCLTLQRRRRFEGWFWRQNRHFILVEFLWKKRSNLSKERQRHAGHTEQVRCIHKWHSAETCKVLLNQPYCKVGQHCAVRCLILTRCNNRSRANLALRCANFTLFYHSLTVSAEA